MTLPSFSRFRAGRELKPEDFERFQDRLEEMLNPLLNNPGNDSARLEDVEIAMTMTSIPHKLGRTPRGWRIVRINAGVTVWESQDPGENFLYLQASGAVTVTLEVF